MAGCLPAASLSHTLIKRPAHLSGRARDGVGNKYSCLPLPPFPVWFIAALQQFGLLPLNCCLENVYRCMHHGPRVVWNARLPKGRAQVRCSRDSYLGIGLAQIECSNNILIVMRRGQTAVLFSVLCLLFTVALDLSDFVIHRSTST